MAVTFEEKDTTEPAPAQQDTDEIEAKKESEATNAPDSSDDESEESGEETVTEERKEVKEVPRSGFVGILMKVYVWISKILADLGITGPKFLVMLKGGLPPAIAFAMYQSDSAASIYGTQGYLIGVSSVYGLAILPRAKFVQHILICVLWICAGTAAGIFALWIAVEARHRLPDQYPKDDPYSGAASVVCGVYLFVMIYLIHSMRAKYPPLTVPSTALSMFTNVAATFGATATSISDVLEYMFNLMRCFLTGFAFATVVSLLIYPRTSRLDVFNEFASYLRALDKALKVQGEYFKSMEKADMLSRVKTSLGGRGGKSPQAAAVKDAAAEIALQHGKLAGDLPFAKREIAYGWLTPTELKKVWKHLKNIMMPVTGLSSSVDLFQRFSESHGWDQDDESKPSATTKWAQIAEWNEIMEFTHDPFQSILALSQEGIKHILYTLRLAKRPWKERRARRKAEKLGDLEESPVPEPGDLGFARYFLQKSEEFRHGRKTTLREWCAMKGIELAPDFFENAKSSDIHLSMSKTTELGSREQSMRQLFMILYMEWLLYSTSQSILGLIKFADEQKAKGYRKHLIFPGSKQFKKWLRGLLFGGDESHSDHTGDIGGGNSNVHLGRDYNYRKDPEHLPATNALERFGDKVRRIPKMLQSSHSNFGLRVAFATLSVSIICFLHDTQTFFIENRLVWAGVMISISMTPTAGQSVFSFVIRCGGVTLATVCSLLAWYIPGQHIPGIIVFLWLFVSLIQYFPLIKPRFTTVGMIASTTLTMIIGFELEAVKLGEEALSASGAAYYNINLLGVYRLAITSCGLVVAFFWTIFPYPISEHGELRRNLGSSLYLLANYYSVVHETMRMRMRGHGGNEKERGTPAHSLAKARRQVYSKQTLLISGLKTYSRFLKFEIPIGGRFPKAKYDLIIEKVENIMNYMTLIRYASQTFIEEPADSSKREWLAKFRRLNAAVNITSHEITSMLALLSASIKHGQPLPPYLTCPQPYRLSQRLQAMDRDILSVRHISEPGYAAFAVMQVSTRCIIGDLDTLLKTVKDLVGELDFSFHAVSTRDQASASTDTLLEYPTGPTARGFADGKNKQR